ncbi:hypothetical protein DFH94DRAFT_302190 [Russula ochroleuca]|uniref:Fungal STAND N-terminal Goodbye domain-containing protein n=1 Tax=Russula ochroleuca TaxID=152965 RepID=A0A9P5MNA7_9AGAM|nr:hypothetical protein DFH94DRAFT_302190 [Russula ochroleuca]
MRHQAGRAHNSPLPNFAQDLLSHPLAAQLQACNSPGDILAVLHQQVQGLDQSRSPDDRWTKWLDPTVNVLYTLSETLGEGVSLVFSPGKVIFAGVGVLLLAAKDVRKGHDTLVDVFERIEGFFRRLEIYAELRPTTEMMETIVQIMVGIISILGIATKGIKEGRLKKYGKRLIGRTDMEDALQRLDKLTQEEARMAAAENLKATHSVDERVREVANTVVAIDNRVASVDDRVARATHAIDESVKGVGEQVLAVDDRVAGVDERVAEVIHGAQIIFSQS